jgi:type VI secretion system protein ImpH
MATPVSGSANPVVPSIPIWGEDLDKVLAAWKPGSPARRLFQEGFSFDFFQAVRLLERLQPKAAHLGKTGPPGKEVVRLKARQALDFPPSAIYEIKPAAGEFPVPVMTVAFMGMTGFSGVLPRHYTEMIMRLERETKGQERYALREWFDLFNHRFLSLFFRAWEKYRFYLAFERKEYARRDPDVFTRSLFSFVGLGLPTLRNRLRVSYREVEEDQVQEHVLARIEDLSLLRFGGFLAHRPRCAVSLEAMLTCYLKVPVQVQQYQGQWIRLEESNQSSLGAMNHAMGRSTVVGDRIWNIQGKIRVRLGPLTYKQFQEYLPDRSAVPQRKAIFLLAQVVRLYVGQELDVDFQLVLKKEEVPGTRMGRGQGFGSRLGWNTWGKRLPMRRHGDEPVFQADERIWLDEGRNS